MKLVDWKNVNISSVGGDLVLISFQNQDEAERSLKDFDM